MSANVKGGIDHCVNSADLTHFVVAIDDRVMKICDEMNGAIAAMSELQVWIVSLRFVVLECECVIVILWSMFVITFEVVIVRIIFDIEWNFQDRHRC